MFSRIATEVPASGGSRECATEDRSNGNIQALRELRNDYVARRREKVIESLLHDYPSGNERRLTEVQNAILAIDQAIADEIELAQSAGPSPGRDRNLEAAAPQAPRGGIGSQTGCSVAHATPTWPSYEAWRSGRKAEPGDTPVVAPAARGPKHRDMRALWQAWGRPAKLTDAQVEEMLRTHAE